MAKCKTKYGTQVRIVENVGNKTKYLKTIGTAKDDIKLTALVLTAQKYINTYDNNLWADHTFDLETLKYKEKEPILLEKYVAVKAINTYAYTTINTFLCRIFKHYTLDKVFKDLVIMRVIQPSSKLKAVDLLYEKFGISHNLNYVYYLKRKLKFKRKEIKQQVLDFAINTLNSNFNLIFYDVTTIYFESFTEDELKKCGFSKDMKFNQPQLVLGLLVDDKGFPLTYRLFKGNTFEGNTFIPVIKAYKKSLNITEITVVADAAMMSKVNFEDLDKEGFKYIIGARLGNSNKEVFESIKQLKKIGNNNTKKVKYGNHNIILHYSQKRATKDRHERLKGIQKAEQLIRDKKPLSKGKIFIKVTSELEYKLNTDLIKRKEVLEGVKGYHTNLDVPELEIIHHYSNLWQIEQNFRVSKTDLEIRPVFQWSKSGIKFHILLNFIALAISKLIEIEEKRSIKSYIKEIMKKQDFYVKSEKGQIFLIKG